MISVVAIHPIDGGRELVCQTRSLEAARATAEVESSRLGRLCLVVDADGQSLGGALDGRLLDRFGELVETPPRIWS
jgi:hypothetical protein